VAKDLWEVDFLGACPQNQIVIFVSGVNTPRVPLIPSHLLQQVAFWLLWENILAENSYFGFSFFSGAPRAIASSETKASVCDSTQAHPI
jgi:hypothetical protein